MHTATLTWRALTREDAPALAKACAVVEAVDATGEHFSLQDIRDQLEDDSIDLGTDTLGAWASDGELVGFARVHRPGEAGGVDRVYADGAVLPAARGRGLGRRLLEWAEGRAAGLHRERGAEFPGAVCVVVHDSNPTKQALVDGAGYDPARWEHTMTRALMEPLPSIPSIAPGPGLTLYTADRDAAVRRAHVEAFADHWGTTVIDEHRWSRWYTGARAFRADVSWLVLDRDEVVAYLLTYFWEADSVATGLREAFVGQLGVRRAWRRRGLGGALLATALRSYRAAGYERAALTVDTANATGALGLYERAGFVATNTYATWIKPLD